MEMKKIGLYIAEILYCIGGTESYTVKLAETLQSILPESEIYFVTEIFEKKKISDIDFVNRLNAEYGSNIDAGRLFLKTIRCSKKSFFSRRLMYQRIQRASKGFDLFFYCSVGNFSFKAKKNIAVIHFPAKKIEQQKKDSHKFYIPFFIRRKDKNYIDAYDYFLPNSNFTSTYLKKYFPEISSKKIKVMYHPVIPIKKLELKKEKIIIACGRIEKSKNYEILIDAYKKSDLSNSKYTFCIIGSLRKEDELYFDQLKKRADSYNIEFICNVSHDTLTEFYNRATIFWHAKGYGESEPYKMEHFGMTTVEAMSAGCIPIVINKGGQMEIVDNSCGFRWNTIDELVSMTENVIKFDENLSVKFSENARKRATEFSKDKFTEEMKELLKVMRDEVWDF